jgi:hypothetical protein
MAKPTPIKVWRDSSGEWRWSCARVFGTADDEAEARQAASQASRKLPARQQTERRRAVV